MVVCRKHFAAFFSWCKEILLFLREAFCRKLKLLTADIHKNVVTHFPSCQTLLEEGISIGFSAFREILDNVSNEFYDRFTEFDSMKKQIELFSTFMEIEIKTLATEFQLEFCNLQSDSFLQPKKNEKHEVFWKLVSNKHFPVLWDFALRMLSIFGSTYICKSTFYVMKKLKSNARNRFADKTMDACLRLATTEVDVDIGLIKNA